MVSHELVMTTLYGTDILPITQPTVANSLTHNIKIYKEEQSARYMQVNSTS